MFSSFHSNNSSQTLNGDSQERIGIKKMLWNKLNNGWETKI